MFQKQPSTKDLILGFVFQLSIFSGGTYFFINENWRAALLQGLIFATLMTLLIYFLSRKRKQK